MSKGYRCYDPVTRHFYHSLNVTFLETAPFFTSPSPSTETVVEMTMKDNFVLLYLVPIFEFPSVPLPLVITTDPSQVYSRHPRSSNPPTASSPKLGISHPIVTSDVSPPRNPTHTCRPPARFLLFCSTNHPISKYVSYQGLSNSYHSFVSVVNSNGFLVFFRIIRLWSLFLSLLWSAQLDANGFLVLSIWQMALLIVIKPCLWLKASLRFLVRILVLHLLL